MFHQILPLLVRLLVFFAVGINKVEETFVSDTIEPVCWCKKLVRQSRSITL